MQFCVFASAVRKGSRLEIDGYFGVCHTINQLTSSLLLYRYSILCSHVRFATCYSEHGSRSSSPFVTAKVSYGRCPVHLNCALLVQGTQKETTVLLYVQAATRVVGFVYWKETTLVGVFFVIVQLFLIEVMEMLLLAVDVN